MDLKPGDNLGRYQLLSPIGKGGMGEVWKARDPRLNRDVAIKVSAAQFSERFEREAKAIAALNHPNICQIYDVGPNYIVMEYIEGAPPRGPLAPTEAVRLALGAAAALEAAHGKGITHRDLKPANVLVTRSGSQSGVQSGVKLLDFGLALVNDNSGVDIADAPTALSVAGAVMGTVAYMSPEQAQGKPADARSDIFSFGLVLYEMLSGRQAFAANSVGETMAAIIRDEPPSLDAPAKLSEIVTRCLRKAPGARFQTMSEVRAALEQVNAQVNAVGADETPSVAVLPFANMSRDPDDEFFSDGLAEEILNLLAKIPGLKVIARTSAFAFKGQNTDIRRIAEALGVRTILEGSVRRSGNRIRVTAQLINAADGYHLWSERYDRELTDVFAMQDEISAAIAASLKLKLTGEPAIARQYEPNLPAYEAFLKGRHQNLTPEGFARAEEYCRQAMALDPKWADPHSYLAVRYFALGILGLRPPTETAPLARGEAMKALELRPSTPTAHALLGGIAAGYDYDWEGAAEQFKLAGASVSLQPEVHFWHAMFYLSPLGHFEEAIGVGAKVLAQDPLNVPLRATQAVMLLAAEMYEPAIDEARKALALDSRNSLSYVVIALSRFFQGKLTEAREAAEENVRLSPWHPGAIGCLAGLLSLTGEKDRAEKLTATLRANVPLGMFMYHLVRSEIDALMDWYERAIELRYPIAVQFASAGFLKNLRASPRWPRLAKMMNLPGSV